MTDSETEQENDVAAYRSRLSEGRRAVAQRLAVEPRAYSADGQTFGFLAPVASTIPIGGYVRLLTQGGAQYLGQVTAKQVTEREGPELTVAGDAGLGSGRAELQVT